MKSPQNANQRQVAPRRSRKKSRDNSNHEGWHMISWAIRMWPLWRSAQEALLRLMADCPMRKQAEVAGKAGSTSVKHQATTGLFANLNGCVQTLGSLKTVLGGSRSLNEHHHVDVPVLRPLQCAASCRCILTYCELRRLGSG